MLWWPRALHRPRKRELRGNQFLESWKFWGVQLFSLVAFSLEVWCSLVCRYCRLRGTGSELGIQVVNLTSIPLKPVLEKTLFGGGAAFCRAVAFAWLRNLGIGNEQCSRLYQHLGPNHCVLDRVLGIWTWLEKKLLLVGGMLVFCQADTYIQIITKHNREQHT